jgi:hypothetical protein
MGVGPIEKINIDLLRAHFMSSSAAVDAGLPSLLLHATAQLDSQDVYSHFVEPHPLHDSVPLGLSVEQD